MTIHTQRGQHGVERDQALTLKFDHHPATRTAPNRKLSCLRYKDIDWDNQMILIRGETEKTYREFSVPIMEGLTPHLSRLLDEAKKIGLSPNDQPFNVNRFSRHYHGKEMNIDQVQAMYRKLTDKTGVRMTPHHFSHTIATDLKQQPAGQIDQSLYRH
ncbi:hypothetical protein BLL38_16730 [Pseudomonas gessardii]|nr:hypothetical protein BLL38_16730 [Pseudomonas gessardii]